MQGFIHEMIPVFLNFMGLKIRKFKINAFSDKISMLV